MELPTVIQSTTAIAPATTTRLITIVDTRDDTVLPVAAASPAAAEAVDEADGTPPPISRKRRRIRLVLGISAGLVLIALVASFFVPVPYYIVSPGSARATEPLVSVEGGREYPPEDGEIYFTTVSTRPARVLSALLGWLDPDADVVDEKLILGDNSAEENREVNLELMDNSVDVAAEVAFEHLGFQVESGTGAIVAGVAPDMPVADVLRPGDVIVAVDGRATDTSDDVVSEIKARDPGDEVVLALETPIDEGDGGGEEGDGDGGGAGEEGAQPVRARTETVELGSRPDDPEAPLLGVQLGTRDQVLDFPFPVEIDTGQVGGPSAGLAFTLAVLDVLTPGELTGGNQVAVTGTIDGLGNVGPIGGIAQKAAAVSDAGADVFIVPAGEADDARAHSGDVRVVGVETLDDALRALDELGGNALALEPPVVDQPADP